MIPRVFHRIWLGTQQMPDEFVQYGETWTKHHPGWAMQLWTDENLPEIINQQEYLLADSTAHKADILRYEVIYRYGGIYIDTDFECLRNIEPLLKGVQAFAASSDPGLVAIGVFGAEREHPLLADVIARLPTSSRRKRYLSITEQTGPDFFTSVVARHPETVVFEAKLFYPYNWREMWRKGQKFPDAYAVHHWSGSWTKSDHQRTNSVPSLRRISSKLGRKLTALALTAKKWLLPVTL
jgi:mannosyltransferase OCH1-like enzyme